ncbi:MAG: chloride channel protein [Prevotellaceae bacterium]|nr:chloride channel protein [Prevotellaceae bacterium]MDY6098879.1 chloride channel protein [Bacteroidaceae bacterium]
MNIRNLLAIVLKWRRAHLSANQFILIISFLVGIFTALAGLLLKWLIGQIEHFLTQEFNVTGANWLYLVYPVVGIFLTMLFIHYVVRDDIGHGVTKILFAIARKQSKIKLHNTWTSIAASAITIGFGGSVGAEAPIVLTGSAIGSNLGRLFCLSGKQMMLLVGCGAAGAVAGIFKAPIAGLVFVLEVLMIDLTMSSLLPLLVSSVTAAGLTFAVSGISPVFEFHLQDPFQVTRIPAYMLLGIACGLVALYFTRTMNWLEGIFRHIKSAYTRLAVGGIMLSLLIYLFPPLYGEGYDLIHLLLNGNGQSDWITAMNSSLFYGHAHLLLLYLVLIIMFKVFASTATNGGGGCGGIFAPSLFLGCVAGFVFSRLWNIYDVLGLSVPERNFAMLGMCGLMSGVMHAPLTGVFLIAELTGGYQLFMPLMIVAVFAYLTIKMFEPHSIYAMRLAQRGDLLTHHTDRSILTLMSMDSVIQHYDQVLFPDMTLADVASQAAGSKNLVFPVVNRQMQLVGAVYLDDIRHLIFRTELYREFRVSQLMKEPEARLSVNDSMDVVVRMFDRTRAWTLPVVNADDVFIGFIRKSHVLAVYRQMMADYSTD